MPKGFVACWVLARSGYYDWKARGESERSKQDRELLVRIEEVHRGNREAYGAVKTWRELNMRGIVCGKLPSSPTQATSWH